MRLFAVITLSVLGLAVVIAIAGFLLVFYQGKRVPVGDPNYVAMGSSFAAGLGLGVRAEGSPIACLRSVNGYPQQLARMLDMPLMDVTCSGATTGHILRGGQYFQRAQLDAVGPRTRLVTITTGGNDIGYVGDLSFTATRNAASLWGWLTRRLWSGPRRPGTRDYGQVRRDIVAVVEAVRRRSPHALVVVVSYPTILPPSGTCPRLNLNEEDVQAMRVVGEQLATATRAAADDTGAILVDMQALGADHHACSAEPWVNGSIDVEGSPFHPTLAGARATAEAIAAVVRSRL